MTRVCQVCLVVQVNPDVLASPWRAKVSLEIRDSPADLVRQAFLGQREKEESWDSPAWQDQLVTMAFLDSLEILDNSAKKDPKVCLEKHLAILEDQAQKASQEIQVFQGLEATMVNLGTMAFQDAEVPMVKKEFPVTRDGLEQWAHLVFRV